MSECFQRLSSNQFWWHIIQFCDNSSINKSKDKLKCIRVYLKLHLNSHFYFLVTNVYLVQLCIASTRGPYYPISCSPVAPHFMTALCFHWFNLFIFSLLLDVYWNTDSLPLSALIHNVCDFSITPILLSFPDKQPTCNSLKYMCNKM